MSYRMRFGEEEHGEVEGSLGPDEEKFTVKMKKKEKDRAFLTFDEGSDSAELFKNFFLATDANREEGDVTKFRRSLLESLTEKNKQETKELETNFSVDQSMVKPQEGLNETIDKSIVEDRNLLTQPQNEQIKRIKPIEVDQVKVNKKAAKKLKRILRHKK